jgi:hypothetical protein
VTGMVGTAQLGAGIQQEVVSTVSSKTPSTTNDHGPGGDPDARRPRRAHGSCCDRCLVITRPESVRAASDSSLNGQFAASVLGAECCGSSAALGGTRHVRRRFAVAGADDDQLRLRLAGVRLAVDGALRHMHEVARTGLDNGCAARP